MKMKKKPWEVDVFSKEFEASSKEAMEDAWENRPRDEEECLNNLAESLLDAAKVYDEFRQGS